MGAMRRGFTVLEMLIAIAVILIIAAMVVPSTLRHLERARVQKCEGILARVEAGLKMYRQDNRHYPRYELAWLDGDWEPATDMAEILYTALHEEAGYMAATVNEDLYTADTDGDGKVEYVDYWGRPVLYLAAVSSPPAVWPTDAPEQRNKHYWSYELWSAGPDGLFTNLRTGYGDEDNVKAPGY